MDKIKKIIRRNLKYKRFQKPLEAAGICEAARIVAEGRFNIISYKNGLLTAACESSAAAANLQAESSDLIEKINSKIGEKKVEKIRFKIG